MWLEAARKMCAARHTARALCLLGLALLGLFAPRVARAAEVYECSTRTAQGKSFGGEETEQQAKDNAHQVVRGLAGKQWVSPCGQFVWL